MFSASILFAFFLHFAATVIAAPASTLHQNVNPDILLRNNQSSLPSSNGTGAIPFKIDNTPITLLITPLLGQKISREALIIALYDSREYIRRHIHQRGDSRLSGRDEPFSSTKLPSPPDVDCVVAVESGKVLKSMTYRYLGDTVQGLMDYTFFPYSASTSSVNFEVRHEIWGVLGTGSLSAFGPQVGTEERSGGVYAG
ncbi:MAG: hypothetical protein HETSPECPRED_003257 [Heterodermia speciosa]|uniref:Uncharacterized protein n=1 Tax=Heterodermia speciosa TaxID=116794 RepID=A0A8H3I5D2_9LECA|nr:MAG: hypothetical protein HETSPECPRED_003257 [Heterodermia speciosa]